MKDRHTLDLFEGLDDPHVREEALARGAAILRGFACQDAVALLQAVQDVSIRAPLRHMVTPGGFRMSAALTSCGDLGWVSDRAGYRYAAVDPDRGLPWPPMPDALRELSCHAAQQAGFAGFVPDACLINRYEPGAKMSLHQDRNERDLDAPIVSVSLGIAAVFQFGGQARGDPVTRVRLTHGDVVVWGGPARLNYHGILPVHGGHHPLTGGCRINLTFRKVL
jgi:alkylated DNA repair protein (DNA oxidative demethylase)